MRGFNKKLDYMNGQNYIAHKNEYTGAIQSVKEHCENTAKLCSELSIYELKDIMYNMGLLHDIGKYQIGFQKRICGESIEIEHSICGAKEAKDIFKGGNQIIGLLLAYCIAGHHGGLPDGGQAIDTMGNPTLSGRLKRITEDYSIYKSELDTRPLSNNLVAFIKGILIDKDKAGLIDLFSFLVRYSFSCLVDADTIDTADFCGEYPVNRSLHTDFSKCLSKICDKINSFTAVTDLQKERKKVQSQVYRKIDSEAEIFIFQMPTGSGKTLCSMRFALERAIRKNKKRIIYVIPYNSIIEQTAEEFQRIFGEAAEILRHQSTFNIDDTDFSEDYRKTVKLSTENWDAEMIITTSVQFFESIYSNKRSKLRKFHNMGDSIIVFDEVHMLPAGFMQPCLQAISYITKILNSEAILMSATMPDFENYVRKYALESNSIVNLIDDKSGFKKFEKCSFHNLGSVNPNDLMSDALRCPSALVVVNSKREAKELFELHSGSGRSFHLSTYMTAYDREKVLSEIKCLLNELEKKYYGEPVPEEERILVISTSLIEAGVDLDFHTVYRELSGIDNILQAAGRCNREGKRQRAESFVFELEGYGDRMKNSDAPVITSNLMKKYDNIADPECIREYYDCLFRCEEEKHTSMAIHSRCAGLEDIPFRSYAKDFKMIPDDTVSLFIPRDEQSNRMLELLKNTGIFDARKAQKYTCSIKEFELDKLIQINAVKNEAGIWYLTNDKQYKDDTGICFDSDVLII